MPLGFTLPFSKTTGSIGHFETTDKDIDAVREDLKSLLLTNWGERVCHYSLGCNFKEFLFETLHAEELKSRVIDRINNQIETWLPFVFIRNIDILLEDDDTNVPENGMKVNMEFGLISRPDLSSRLEVIVSR